MIELARLPRLLLILKWISLSSRDLKSSLEQARLLRLNLGGHQCFLSNTASSLCWPSENALATKLAIIYTTKSFSVV